MAEKNLKKIENKVRKNTSRVADFGDWPSYIRGKESLTGRLPLDTDAAPGFDAGLACALGKIPESKQELAATLHAAYTKAAVEQVRSELKLEDEEFVDSQTCWWLAACSVCEEGGVNEKGFFQQLDEFEQLADEPQKRIEAAREEWEAMQERYFVTADGIAYAHKDGGMQAAYLEGHPFAVQCSPEFGLFFVATFHPTLGIPEEFGWSNYEDDQGRPMSGPVHGSQQYVKAATLGELNQVIEIVRDNLGVKE